MAKSSIFHAQSLGAIKARFQTNAKKVFNEPELYRIHRELRSRLRTLESISASEFVQGLIQANVVRLVELPSEHYASKKRFAHEGASALEVALSLAKRSFLSHATAVLIHGLSDQIPKTIYVNCEQSPKPTPKETPTQERIDRAFAGRQRTSKYVFSYESNRIVLLSGKATGRFGIETIKGPNGELVETTSIERTLVDIVVRPAYSGGVVQILEAFRGARGTVSGRRLFATLTIFDYTYPYHQSIGYLLDRAGYPRRDVEPFRQLPQEFDFYLVHGMKETDYIPEWRLHIPKGF